MSRWVEANKSRSVGIGITRRPGSKEAKTIFRKSRHRSFYRSDRRSLISGAFIMHCDIPSTLQSHVFRLRLYPTEYVLYVSCTFLIAHVYDERLEKRARKADAGEEGGEVEREWRGNGAREDAGGMSDRRHSDGRERTLLIYYLITDLLPGRAIGDATTCTGTPDVDLPV